MVNRSLSPGIRVKELIARVDFLYGLDDRIVEKIADACIVRQFVRAETILRPGETEPGLYVIAKGHVKVERERADVRMRAADLGPGQYFGEMSLLDYRPRSIIVTAIEDIDCLLLTRDNFIVLMNEHVEIPIHMARMLADKLHIANEKLDSSIPPVRPGGLPPVPPAFAAVQYGPLPATSVPEGNKERILATLLETFQTFYTIKALSRFSVALLGCPVEGSASNLVAEIRVGDVKALLFPAGEPVDMRIAAQKQGSFTLHVFTPSIPWARHFGPLAIDPRDNVLMTLRRGITRLQIGETEISFTPPVFLA